MSFNHFIRRTKDLGKLIANASLASPFQCLHDQIEVPPSSRLLGSVELAKINGGLGFIDHLQMHVPSDSQSTFDFCQLDLFFDRSLIDHGFDQRKRCFNFG